MYHGHHTNGSRGETPRILIDVLFRLRLRIFKGNVEHLREVLTQVMRCGCLKARFQCHLFLD